MLALSSKCTRRIGPSQAHGLLRNKSTSTQPAEQKEGDISSVFVSLSGGNEPAPPLPQRYADLKRRLLAGREDEIKRGWDRLLHKLKDEVRTVKERGSSIIPSIEFKDIKNAPASFREELQRRGIAVIRGVVPEAEARSYKEEIEAYVRANPSTKGMHLSILKRRRGLT